MPAIFHRALVDSFLVFDTGPKLIGLAVLGAIVTALIVLGCRGWEQFKEHVIANVFIAFGGALATWLLVFLWVCVHVPTKMQAEAKDNLDRVIEEKRQLSMAVNTKQAEIDRLNQRQPSVLTRTVKAPEPEKKCWASNVFGMPNSRVRGGQTATEAIIRCNYKIDAPFRVVVEFDRDFIPGGTTFPDAEGPILAGGDTSKQGTVYFSHIIQSPALLSNHLVVVTVYGNTDQYPRVVKGGITPVN